MTVPVRIEFLTVSLLAAVALLFSAAPAAAGPMDTYGFGGRATGMGGAQTADAVGPEALFYNVGALGNSEQRVAFGMIFTVNQADILLHDRPQGYDVPDLGFDSPAVPSGNQRHPRSDTIGVAPYHAVSLGGVTSFGLERLRVGAMVQIPLTGFLDLSTHFADERERIYSNQLHYEFLGKSNRRFSLGFGGAYKVTDWMSVGLGALYVPGAAPGVEVFVEDLANQADVDLNADIPTTDNWGLLAGAVFELPLDLKLGLAYRGETYFEVNGQNTIYLGTENPAAEPIVQEFNWTPSYSPETFSGGVAWSPEGFQLQADLRFIRWSRYRDTQSAEPPFQDVFQGHLGAEVEVTDSTLIRAGVGYIPTPVPPQTGRTNYVDNNRLKTGLGAAHRFKLLGQDVEVEWALQLQSLFKRSVQKRQLDSYPDCGPGVTDLCDEVPDDTTTSETGRRYPEAQGLQTGNPGFPGFTSGGWLGGLVVDLAWRPDA